MKTLTLDNLDARYSELFELLGVEFLRPSQNPEEERHRLQPDSIIWRGRLLA